MARKIWKFTHLEDEIKHIIREDMLSVMHRLIDSLGNNELNYVAAIWWVTWNARNKLIFLREETRSCIFSCQSKSCYGSIYKSVENAKRFQS